MERFAKLVAGVVERFLTVRRRPEFFPRRHRTLAEIPLCLCRMPPRSLLAIPFGGWGMVLSPATTLSLLVPCRSLQGVGCPFCKSLSSILRSLRLISTPVKFDRCICTHIPYPILLYPGMTLTGNFKNTTLYSVLGEQPTPAAYVVNVNWSPDLTFIAN